MKPLSDLLKNKGFGNFFLLTLLLILMTVVSLSSLPQKKNTTNIKASEVSTSKLVYQEVTSSTKLAPHQKTVQPQVIKNPNTLPITGEWHNKDIKIVPNDRFYPEEQYFTYYGIRALKAVKDDRIFVGGMGAFIIKDPDDSEWQQLQLVTIPVDFGIEYNVILKIAETGEDNFDTYLMGNKGTVKYNSDGTLEEVVSPFDPGSHLEDLIEIIPYGQEGMAAFRQYEIYYFQNGMVRKWNTPKPDPAAPADSVKTLFQDLSDGSNTNFYGIVYHCTPISGSCYSSDAWDYYLYQYNFPGNPDDPLETTQLGLINIDNSVSLNQMKNGIVQKRADDPNKKIFYSQANGGQIVTTISDFDPDYPELDLAGTWIPGPYGYGTFKDYDIEIKGGGDVLWGAAGTGIGMYYTTGFDTGTTPNFDWMDQSEINMLANPYSQSASINHNNNTIFVGHVFLSNQFNEALVTIFEDYQPPTPTATITPQPTNTPSPSPRPINTCYKPCSSNADCVSSSTVLVCGTAWCKPGSICMTILRCYNPKCPYNSKCICP